MQAPDAKFGSIKSVAALCAEFLGVSVQVQSHPFAVSSCAADTCLQTLIFTWAGTSTPQCAVWDAPFAEVAPPA